MLYSNRYKQPARATFGNLSSLVTEDLERMEYYAESRHAITISPSY